ncbi:MAG: acyl--CoA ligase [Chromatiales bacterium]|jgi:fatty-acyl-CoA synthase|nr:acyl--CoA ligase [Chromatiales bacterium]
MTEPFQTVAEAFIRITEKFPDNEAIVSANGERYSYRDLFRHVESYVSILDGLGCGPGDRVAVWLSNRPEWAFAEYACAVMGVVLVPVNARFRADEAQYVLAMANVKVLITEPNFLTNDYVERLREIAGGSLGTDQQAHIERLPKLETIILVDDVRVAGTACLSELAASAGEAPDLAALAVQRSANDAAWVFWTSGSTGHPKGAVIPHHSIGNVCNWTTVAAQMGPDDRVLTSFPLFYVAGNFWCLLGALVHGATLVMSAEFDAESIVRACRDEKVTVMSGIPFMLKEVVHDSNFDPAAFETVRVGFFGGATMPRPDIEIIIERIGYEHFLQIYGMTESQGICLTTTPEDSREIQLSCCGYPLPDFDIQLVDPQTGVQVEGEGEGEIWMKGRTHLHYEGLDEEVRAGFYSDDGYFRTGDVMRRRADGRYEFVTRVKDLIKVGGENVAAAEIERVLKDHPSVFNVQVVPLVDDRRGEVPAAFVELVPGAPTLELDELRAWALARMAPFKVPRRLRIMTASEWPRTSTAKIARFKLPELLEA